MSYRYSPLSLEASKLIVHWNKFTALKFYRHLGSNDAEIMTDGQYHSHEIAYHTTRSHVIWTSYESHVNSRIFSYSAREIHVHYFGNSHEIHMKFKWISDEIVMKYQARVHLNYSGSFFLFHMKLIEHSCDVHMKFVWSSYGIHTNLCEVHMNFLWKWYELLGTY